MRKNFIKILLGVCLLFTSLPACSQTASEFFDLGVRAYAKGDFAIAAENFEKSSALEANAAAFHNLGNAYAKLSKPGLARLNYERARYLNPRSPETRANLDSVIRENGADRENSIVSTIFGELSNSEWTICLIASAWGGAACFIIIPPFVRKKRLPFLFGVLCCIAFLFSFSGRIYWHKVRNTAVALSPDVMLKISAAENAPPSHAMGEAKSAKIIRENGAYILVEFPPKKYGWSKKETLAPIWPLQSK